MPYRDEAGERGVHASGGRETHSPGWMVEQYLRNVADEVRSLAQQGRGREVLGGVPGRSREEDEEIGIDRACDRLLDVWCRRAGLPVRICSEHGVRRPDGEETPPEYLVAVDPFDGSGLFRRRLPAEWWSVLTVYRAADLAPICGGAIDILRRELYLADGQAVRRIFLDSGADTHLIAPKVASLDGETVIAAFLMDPAYLTRWAREAGALLDTLVRKFPTVRIWPNGGSCIYPWLAAGLVHAYVMFDEPRAEVDPGLAFAASAGFPVYTAGGDGRLELYRFDPTKSAGRVPLLIAASTESLARNILVALSG